MSTKLLIFVLLVGLCRISPVSSLSLIWSDNFDTLDTSKWNFENGDGCPSLCNFGNNELQWYQAENAYVSNGKLVIEAKKENGGNGKSYTSAKLMTKVNWKFGRIEVSARLPEGRGIWPAIWMLPAQSQYPWPKGGEINIMELLGHDPSTVHMVAHYGEAWDNKGQLDATYTLPEGKKFIDDFHKFAIEWREDEIKWFVDDSLKLTVTKSQVNSDRGFYYPFNNEFYLILNVAVGGNWPGNPDTSTNFPQKMEVDYVNVYSL